MPSISAETKPDCFARLRAKIEADINAAADDDRFASVPRQQKVRDIEYGISSTALHEAAHAVVSILLRTACLSASIVPDDQTAGRMMHATAGSFYIGGCLRNAVVTSAGPQAQIMAFEREGEDAFLWRHWVYDREVCETNGWRGDYDQLRDVTVQTRISPMAVQRVTRTILDEYWDDVITIAIVLDMCQELAGTEMRRMISDLDRKQRRVRRTLLPEGWTYERWNWCPPTFIAGEEVERAPSHPLVAYMR